jgi:hypothetical protein
MATKSKKTAARNARTSVKAKATRKYIRVVFDDNAKIRVIGEHNRRENSRYGKQYEMLRRVKTGPGASMPRAKARYNHKQD